MNKKGNVLCKPLQQSSGTFKICVLAIFLLVCWTHFVFGMTPTEENLANLENLLEEKSNLNTDDMEVLCTSTLLVSGNIQVAEEGILEYEQIGNIHIITYESLELAKNYYKYYSDQEAVISCEYDSVVGTQELENSTYLQSGLNYNGGTVKIALLDTGATGEYEISYNTFDGSENVTDDHGHGTYMASIIQSYTNATIIPIKVIGENGVGTVSEVLKGLTFAAEQEVSIINMSFVTTYGAGSAILESYIELLESEGIYIVASAGNDNENTAYYSPANMDSIIVVGSADAEGNKTDFSNYGNSVDFNVYSSSTSEAAAMTSGLMGNALEEEKQPEYVLQNNPNWFINNWVELDYPEYYMTDDNTGEIIWCTYEAWTNSRSTLGTEGDTLFLNEAVKVSHSVVTDVQDRWIIGTATIVANKVDEYCYVKVDGEWYVHLQGYRTDNGWSTTGWYLEEDVVASTGSNNYTYVWDANGGSVSPESTTGTYGSWIVTPEPTRTGYTFNGWLSTTGNVFAAGATWQISSNGVYTAQWTANTYTVKFNGNGSTSGSMSNVTMTYGTSQSLPSNTFVKDGYLFMGWATSATGDVKYTNQKSVENLTSTKGNVINLYAVWSCNSYYLDVNSYLNDTYNGTLSDFATVDVYINGTKVANDVSDYFQKVEYGSTYKITDIKCSSSVYNDGNAIYSGTIGVKVNNVYIYLKTYCNITFDPSGGYLSETTLKVEQEVDVLLPKPEKEGYRFIGWYLEETDEIYEEGTEIEVFEDTLFIAIWDSFPSIIANDVYMYLENEIDETRIYDAVEAWDAEDGDLIDLVSYNRTELEEEITSLRQISLSETTEYTIELCYSVTDSAGNTMTCTSYLHLYGIYNQVDMSIYEEENGYVRFISDEYLYTIDVNSIWNTTDYMEVLLSVFN